MTPRIILAVLAALFIVPGAAHARTSSATLTLDGLSFLSFDNSLPLSIPPGGTLVFRFGSPRADGSVPFTIAPSEVSLPPVPVTGSDATIRYTLASTASGALRRESDGIRIDFTATIRSSSNQASGSYTYTLAFTTEQASASDVSGSRSIAVQGVRLDAGPRYVQLVGATTNRADAVPAAGTAVYAVLSGSFDRLPGGL